MNFAFRTAALILLLPGISCVARAQTSAADEVLAAARKTYTEKGSREALPEFEKALGLYRAAGDRKGEAITLGYIGNCYKKAGDFARALEYLNRALALKRELGDRLEEGKTLSHLGLLFWEKGEYPAAIEHLTKSIAIARELGEKRLEAAALNNLSLVYDEIGDYRRSLDGYQKALELQRALGEEGDESSTLGNIGGIHLLLGQFRDALHYYQQALAIDERLRLKDSTSIDLGNIALSQAGLGQFREASETFDRAIALARETGAAKPEADWHKGKGSVLWRAGRYDAARDEYRLALQTYERAGLKRELAEALNDDAELHLMLGDRVAAEAELRRAVELSRSIGHPRGVTTALTLLGDLEWRRGRLEEAAALYREALSRARDAGERTHMAAAQTQLALVNRSLGKLDDAQREAQQALDAARAAGARPDEARALLALAEVQRTRGSFREALVSLGRAAELGRDIGDPEITWRATFGEGQAHESLGEDQQAVGAYKRAIEAIESVRGQIREERFRAGYLEDKYQVYVALVRLLLRLNRVAEAFEFAERARARSYLDLFNRGLPPIRDEAVRRAELELRERIRKLQRAVSEEASGAAPERRGEAAGIFREELRVAERAYQALIDDLRRSDPAYAAARALAVPSSDDLRRQLPASTALIEYVVGADSVSIFVISAEGLHATSVPVKAADLRGRIELLRDLVVTRSGTDWLKPAAGLRRVLVEPVEKEGWLKGIRRVYIVPHEILHYLPFAGLAQETSPRARFLVEDYEIAYLPAAAALAHAPPVREENKLLAAAPASARLRYAEAEARGVWALFAGERKLLLGARATESAFKQSAPRFSFIHLATHGYFNKFNPLFSGVQLEAGGSDDGRLDVHEILGMRLDSNLVVLSACETALAAGYFSDVPAGDDFVGLTRAFLFAGSRSVLATLWEVNDRSTMALMEDFYRRLVSGNDKAKALAEAQRAMLKSPARTHHPYFWAPFILSGQATD